MDPNYNIVKILHLEDNRYDIDLVKRLLSMANIEFELQVACEAETFNNSLFNFEPDIIIADHSMPSFNSLEALRSLQKYDREIPFILFTGTLSEDDLVEMVKEGADDYVLKDRPQRLVTAITNALEKYTSKRNHDRLTNELLEQKVAERTFELQEANKALEAFSYSVSHDLRAPVRAIASFSKIISKEYGTVLNKEVLDLLAHIEGNSKRMNVIIDDLLALAQYTRQEPKLIPADMNSLFRNVWNNIHFSAPHNAELQLPELPVVFGDVSMLEQVVVNLLSNAIKYSSKKEHPVIKVGYEKTDGNNTFYVQDNGAGFDMQYYDRLFGVFERLHSTIDFEGTGVGLFLVKKIIEKHGGTVWAKGKVNEGAVFYFALPEKN